MRKQEYFELAKRSLQLRKKSTRATVIGLAIGFALLLPIIVGLFGVNVSFTSQLNKNPYSLYARLSVSDYRIATDDYINPLTYTTAMKKINISGSKHIDSIIKKTDSQIVYEQFVLGDNFSLMSSKVNSEDFVSKVSSTQKCFYSVIDLDKSDSIFPKNLTKNYKDGIFLKGYDQGFVNDGKKQIVLSESFVNKNGLSAQDLYQKPFTLEVNCKIYPDNDETAKEFKGYLCKDYTVVGIIKNEVTNIYSAYEEGLMSSDMFFTSVNLYDIDGQGVLKPYYNDNRNLTYDNLDNLQFLNQEYMLIPTDANRYSLLENYNLYTFSSTQIYIESSSYANLNKDVVTVEKYFSDIFNYKTEYLSTSSMYSGYSKIYSIFNMVSLIIAIISLVLAFCAFINMYSSISHSVKERRQYLTMMRAIGAKDNTILRLYMVESVLISARVSCVISTIGLALSVGIKYIFSAILKMQDVTFPLTIPWWTIFVTLIAVVVLVFGVGLLFSYLCTKRLSKQKITEILNSN